MAYGRGHVKGTKKERKPTKPWWAEQEEMHIRAVERAWERTTREAGGKVEKNS